MPPPRQNFSSNGPYEDAVGYSRAVRVGLHVFIAGTTATLPGGQILGVGDAHAQTVQALLTLEAALQQAGATLAHVVRTRLYVVNIARDGDAVARAHGDAFRAIRPAATLVEVRALIHPDLLVEIEADAIIT